MIRGGWVQDRSREGFWIIILLPSEEGKIFDFGLFGGD
jgi:hypothetical protein